VYRGIRFSRPMEKLRMRRDKIDLVARENMKFPLYFVEF